MEVLSNARTDYGFVGVDTDEFPYDIETHVRYHRDLPEEIEDRHPHLPPLSFDRFDSITSDIVDEYAIEWDEKSEF